MVEHVALLKQGAATWNAWRDENPRVRLPDLREAILTHTDLRRANLRRANLCEADLREAILTHADLRLEARASARPKRRSGA